MGEDDTQNGCIVAGLVIIVVVFYHLNDLFEETESEDNVPVTVVAVVVTVRIISIILLQND